MASFVIDINTAKYDELMSLFKNKTIALNIIRYRSENGLFIKKQLTSVVIGKNNYNMLKSSFVISLPADLLKIDDDYEYLDKLSKYNDDKVNFDIYVRKKKIADMDKNSATIGYNYILHYSGDAHIKWYKVGETSKEPEERAAKWRYNLKYFRITSCRKSMERLLHKYLNFAHCLRPAIHGKGMNEVEWFYISFELIKRTMDAVINTCDPIYKAFKKFKIIRYSDLFEENIAKKYRERALILHPDKNPKQKKICEKKFKSLTDKKNIVLKFINKSNQIYKSCLPADGDKLALSIIPVSKSIVTLHKTVSKTIVTVYKTPCGKKYHHESCRYAKGKDIQTLDIVINDALKSMLCSFCKFNFR
jgi:hypothetical protein